MEWAVKIFCPITISFYKVLLNLVLTVEWETETKKLKKDEFADYWIQNIKSAFIAKKISKGYDCLCAPKAHI